MDDFKVARVSNPSPRYSAASCCLIGLLALLIADLAGVPAKSWGTRTHGLETRATTSYQFRFHRVLSPLPNFMEEILAMAYRIFALLVPVCVALAMGCTPKPR